MSRPLSELSVKEIRDLVAGAPPEPGDSLWGELCRDRRKAGRELVRTLKRRNERETVSRARELEMRCYESELWDKGLELVAGEDEVGRGPLAGPVVAAAVVLPRELPFRGIDDSKKLLPERREELHDLIRGHAVAIGIGSVSHTVIDEINILRATHRAICEAVSDLGRSLGRPPGHALLDGEQIPDLEVPQTAIHRGDELSTAIAAASIVAKVTRDRLLVEYDRVYPGYGFTNHKGYGTPEHLAALTKLGPCEVHRRSFTPVFQNGGRSDEYEAFKRMFLEAESIEQLDAAAAGVSEVAESLERYEVARLRDLYKRSYKRIKSGFRNRR